MPTVRGALQSGVKFARRLTYIHYFCGNTEIATDLEEREPQRAALYKAAAGLVRAYAGIADELEQAGYDATEAAKLKKQTEHFVNVREVIRKASGESIDLKAYEADMRHLIDTYIQADEPRKISPFDGMSLVELIVKMGSPTPSLPGSAGLRETRTLSLKQ
jgi:type I restriction enzyme, R subunit